MVLVHVLGGVDHPDDDVQDTAAGKNQAVNGEFADGVLELFPVQDVAGHQDQHEDNHQVDGQP